MTIAKGIHYPVGGNALAVPLRCDADGRLYLADFAPPPAGIITGPEPAAGAEAFLDVPTGEYLEVISVSAVLVADSTEIVRVPTLKLLDGPDGNVLGIGTGGPAIQADETGTTSWAPTYGGPGSYLGGSVQGSSMDLYGAMPSGISVAPPGSRLITLTEHLQPGDKYEPLRVLCRRNVL